MTQKQTNKQKWSFLQVIEEALYDFNLWFKGLNKRAIKPTEKMFGIIAIHIFSVAIIYNDIKKLHREKQSK